MTVIEYDYNLALMLRTQLVPNAVKWYLNEVEQDEDEDYEDDEEDEVGVVQILVAPVALCDLCTAAGGR
jgi:hypothetical protein